ncbi:MAG: 2-hydroxyacid dehydrogenase [Fibrobacteria bacterium]
MKVAFFSAKSYEHPFFAAANAASSIQGGHEISYLEPHLSPETLVLALGHDAVCAFVNDQLGAAVLEGLARQGIRYIIMRCAGFNRVDLQAAQGLGIKVARVPAYSPYSVAEQAVALMLDLNRKIHRAFARVRDGNFSLDGLMGRDMHGLTAGIIGLGKIGMCTARILNGFGMKLLAHDLHVNPEAIGLGVRYVGLERLLGESDVISLHCPLSPETHHLIDADAIARLKPGVMLINTSRGDVVDTKAVIQGLKSGRIGNLGLDVYEEEESLFFEDLSDRGIQDDVFSRLLSFPNVTITGHQAFFTRNAMEQIAQITIGNLDALSGAEGGGRACANLVSAETHLRKSG